VTKHWVRFLHADAVHFGTLEDDRIQVYSGDMYTEPTPSESTLLLHDVKLLTPTRPSKVIALWNNFHALAKKLNLSSPAEPLYVIKAPNAYLNPGETILSSKVNWALSSARPAITSRNQTR
jgi:2-keto-4-pentenoate hydratase/2-oxohepta-3-ene-1,7-dioic acid hydratase in catechol pathway